MNRLQEAAVGVVVGTGMFLAGAADDVLAHDAEVTVLDRCAGEGSEVSVYLTGFQNHDLLGDVVEVDFISTNSNESNAAAISYTVDEDLLITDGSERVDYDLSPGLFRSTVEWTVDYNNNGIADPGETKSVDSELEINFCVQATPTTSGDTTASTTSTVDVANPPEVSVTPSTTAGQTPGTSTSTTAVTGSSHPVESKLPSTGNRERLIWNSLYIALGTIAAGWSAIWATRRRSRTSEVYNSNLN